MMYIEHTNLEDNLHYILTNREPTSSSPSATEASAASAAASALLARVREAQESSVSSALQQQQQIGGQLSASNNKTTSTPHYKLNKEWLRRPEPKLLPVENLIKFEVGKELRRPSLQQTRVLESVTVKTDTEEEEQYELLHVIDSEPQVETSETLQNTEPHQEGSEEVDNLASTSHFILDLHSNHNKIINTNDQNLRDDDEEFEYIVTRVPKKKQLQQQEKSYTTSQINNYNLDLKTKLRRPVPKAIPIEPHTDSRAFNGHFAVPQQPPPQSSKLRKHSIDSQEYFTHRKLNGYASFIDEEEDYRAGGDYTETETIQVASTGRSAAYAYYNDHNSRQEDQMGLDIINRLKQYFNWNSSENHYSTTGQQQEGKRKRRSEDWSGETSDPHQIKYRKVENRFPKYIAAHTEEDDVIDFITPRAYQQQQQQQQQEKSNNYDKQYLLNNSNHSSKTSLEMSNRRSTSNKDKLPLRKSMFLAPNITQQLIKNTPYADVEFSDDDESILLTGFNLKPSTSVTVKHAPKIYNIPIMRADERLKSMQQKPPPPPLIEPRTGSILQSSLIPELKSLRKPTYAEALRQSNTRSEAGVGHVLGGRNSISSSAASASDSSRVFNGLNSMRTNHWSNQNRSSILDQEKESEEREKYQQLLEQVVPRLYGTTRGENKHPTSNTLAQRRRAALLLGTGANTSSARSSPGANRRSSFGLGHSLLKRPPLSSTINLDDDDDEDRDVTITGISQLKTSRSAAKTKQRPLRSTVIIDDDEISDIVELGNEERHVLSACAKIQKEQNSVINLCEEKVEKPAALPFVEPVNSLKERFSASPHMKDNWLENFQSKWFQRKKNRHEEVKETVKVAEKISAERRAAEAEIQERLRRFQIVDPELLIIDEFENAVEEPEFVELTQKHRERINAAICGPPDQILVSKFNLNITRRDIHTLCGHNWLNDEVINFYMNLLTERGEKRNDSDGLPKVYAMNTFFVPRLLQAGHAGVKRWTRKVDIFTKDIMPVPVHVGGVHWCMAIIHLTDRTIKYYDSMGTPNPKVLKALEQYLKDESLDKRKQPYDTSGYTIESVQGVPRQMNGSDCGVFSCMFAEYITRNRDITFSQQNMEYFRQKMILEIVMGELLQ